ncbi:uncharacterized protein TNCV_4366601 [Trichonephila clavipes]|nr:uncharacterized protein TNCV_4366601 [Trichonephila clavipes]
MNVFEKCNADLEGEKDFNDDHREEFTDCVQLILGFQECDREDVETGIACDAEDWGVQMLSDDEIVTSIKKNPTLSTIKRMKTGTTTTTKVARVNQMLTRFLLQYSTVVSREAKSDGKTQGQGYLGNFGSVIWNKLWPDLEGEKDFNDDHREEITDFVQSIPGFQECNEDVETWMAWEAEDCGFQMLNECFQMLHRKQTFFKAVTGSISTYTNPLG